MKSDILTEIMKWFNFYVTQGQNDWQELLIIDIFSGHKDPDRGELLDFPGALKDFRYQNVTVLFLLSNTTSTIQPLNQGIVCYKSYYWLYNLYHIM